MRETAGLLALKYPGCLDCDGPIDAGWLAWEAIGAAEMLGGRTLAAIVVIANSWIGIGGSSDADEHDCVGNLASRAN